MVKKTVTGSKSNTKAIVEDVINTLTGALVNLKKDLGDKKFEKRIRKAAKLITDGLKPAKSQATKTKKTPVKKAPVKKAPVKKATVKE